MNKKEKYKNYLYKHNWQKIIEVKQNCFSSIIVFESLSKFTSEQLEINFNFKNLKYIENTISVRTDDLDYFEKAIRKSAKEHNLIVEKELELLLKKYNLILKNWLGKTNEIKRINIQRIAVKELLKLLLEYVILGEQRLRSFALLPIVAEEIIKKELMAIIGKEIEAFFVEISDVRKGGYLWKERKSLANLQDNLKKLTKERQRLVYRDKQMSYCQLKEFNNFCHLFNRHLRLFSWMNTRNYHGYPWTKQDLLNRLQEFSNLDLKKEVKKIELARYQSEEKYKKFLTHFKNKRIKRLSNLLRRYIFARTFNRDTITIAQNNNRPILESIAINLRVSYEELLNFSYREIVNALRGRNLLKKAEGRKRARGFAMLMHDGKIDILTAGEIKKLKFFNKADKIEKIEKIIGMVANRGFAKGYAKIVKTVDEIGKVKKGDILVAPTTFSNYLPAMEKAAAFITDIGGLTCHAAIVSRELGVPCIVGTKIATQILKDGDLVEVDAEKGMVKIIKKHG